MRVRILFLVTGLVASLSTYSPAQAVYGGSEVTGSPLVLTLLTSKGARASFCSMALLNERIVVTAAHCVIKDQGAAPELRWNLGDFYVSQPGADVTRDDIETRVRVSKVVTRDDFINTWKPEIGDRRTQINDIAFLFLEKPLVKNYSMEIATEEEVNQAIVRGALVTHYGYGLQTVSTQSHSPWMTKFPLQAGYDSYLDSTKVIYSREGPAAMCPGDSGGPWYIDVNGVTKIAAVLVAASGCRGNPPYSGVTLGTRIYPYMPMAKEKWEEFAAIEKVVTDAVNSKNDQIEVLRAQAVADGSYLGAGGCHSKGINAEVQIKRSDGSWAVIAPTIGWTISASSCPVTHPVQPWTIISGAMINEVNEAQLRWRYWADSFNLYGDPFTWSNQNPIPTPIITNQNKVTSTPRAVIRKTITCKKGALLKKVTGSNPKCPKGWKLKVKA